MEKDIEDIRFHWGLGFIVIFFGSAGISFAIVNLTSNPLWIWFAQTWIPIVLGTWLIASLVIFRKQHIL